MPASNIVNQLLNNNQPEDIEDRVAIIRHKLKFIDTKPSVACIAHIDPLTISAAWVNELAAIAGAIPVAPQHDYTLVVNDAYLHMQDPDIIVVMLSGLNMQMALSRMDSLLQQPGFTELKAVKNKRLYIADGSRYTEQPSAEQLTELLEMLAEIINPKQFIFGYEGEVWIRFDV